MFVEAYLKTWNASEAARRAGYKNERVAGHRLITDDNVAAEIRHRLDEEAMGADEVLRRLAEQARFDPVKYIGMGGRFDLGALEADGFGHLLKGVRPTQAGIVYEFHDGQVALIQLGKAHKLFTDKQEITVSGPVTQIIVREVVKEE